MKREGCVCTAPPRHDRDLPALNGTYGTISTGRYGISATTGASSTAGSLLGGFNLTLYTVDGTTFPFIEYDAAKLRWE